jgi:hypothetical protein
VNYQDGVKQAQYDATTLPQQAKVHKDFASRYLRLSTNLTTSEELRDFCVAELDAIVVGSDAVFRVNTRYDLRRVLKRATSNEKTTPMPEVSPYWLPWPLARNGHRIPKAALAASAAGTQFYLIDIRSYRKLRKSLLDFDRITVRDWWTSLMVRSLSMGAVTAVHCPDPVFVLKSHFVLPRDEHAGEDLSDVIFVSGRFPEAWLEKLRSESHKLGYRLGSLPNPDRAFGFSQANPRVELPLSPLRWFDMLGSAAAYVGIRFHALVTCMANNTPFITVDPGKRFDVVHQRLASRYRDLCRRARVVDRYVLERKVASSDPATLLSRLFDESSRRNAAAYAAFAEERFEAEVDAMVETFERASVLT